MKWVAMCAAPVAVVGGVYMNGPAKSSETYPRAIADVEYTLGAMSLPSFVDSTLNTLPSGNSTRTVVPGKSVTYYFRARGGEAGKFVAEISAVDATHTRVTTSMTMNGNADELMKAKFMPVGKEFGVVGGVAMREQIDARLEQRPFNQDVIKQAMASFVMTNAGDIMKHAGDAMDEAAKLQNATYEPTVMPGQPMVDPRASR